MPPPDTISPEHRLALPVGFQLEEYRIVKVLGQGGFGITYLAEDTRMNHQVAIKELLPTDFATRSQDYTVVPLTQSDEPDLAWAKQRFIDEARILVRLNHPNIVRFFRYFELNSTAYLVMEFVRGQNFKGWMQSASATARTGAKSSAIAVARWSGIRASTASAASGYQSGKCDDH